MIQKYLKNIVILYHAECPDGFGAAWVAHKRFGDQADYIGVYYNSPVPGGLNDKELYLVDFAYPVEIMKDLLSRNKRVTAIDHHISTQESVKLTRDYLYSVDRSGSVLSWIYFYPKDPVPKMLGYIEDRDLYKFKLPDSRSVCAFIDTLSYDFNIWDDLATNLEDDMKRNDFIEKGKIIVDYEAEIVKKIIEENARLVQFEGYETFVVNAPHNFADDIAHSLYIKKPPIAIIWREDKERVTVSLRSDGSVDVSKIAAKFNGGGHKTSAGFVLASTNSFPWK